MIARVFRFAMALVTAGAMAGSLLMGSATSAFADYGSGNQYQIEISDNCNGLQNCLVAQGDGVWLWIELNADGTGDYQAADCAHNVVEPNGTTISGAFHDSGDTTWSVTNGVITINGVRLLGGAVPVTITVPANDGHYTETASQIFPNFPIPGEAQVQVAP